MSARRKRVLSSEEIQFNHKPAKMLLTEKKKGVSQNGQTPSIIGICSYCVLDRPVFERCQTLLHPELTPWWSFLLADGAHHKKPHSPTHPRDARSQGISRYGIDLAPIGPSSPNTLDGTVTAPSYKMDMMMTPGIFKSTPEGFTHLVGGEQNLFLEDTECQDGHAGLPVESRSQAKGRFWMRIFQHTLSVSTCLEALDLKAIFWVAPRSTRITWSFVTSGAIFSAKSCKII